MNRRSVALLIALFGILGFGTVSAEESSVWSVFNQHDQAFHVNSDHRTVTNDKYESERKVRNQRNREPTTRRPMPGEPPSNGDIDDYDDENDGDKNRIGSRYFPYVPNGSYGNQLSGNGFNGYQGMGGFRGNSAGNGILVGPGGPTGFIGRPQTYSPSNTRGAAGTLGQPGFGTYPGGIIIGYPVQTIGNGVTGVYSNGFGHAQGFPVTQGEQYPSIVYNPNRKFPGDLSGGYSAGAHYPVIGQYPMTSGQAPITSGPLYTAGYTLANSNGYAPTSPGVFLQNLFGTFNGFRKGNDAYDESKSKLKASDQNTA